MTRKEFLKLCLVLGVSPLLGSSKKEKDLMPALFISHGSPMNIVRNNAYTNALVNVTKEIPKPRAIVVISAHWYENKTYISNMQKTRNYI
jgi:4,5-DOPA dioxygenase extradiol